MFGQALLVGATGMLSGVAVWASQNCGAVVTVSRHPPSAGAANVEHIVADWRESDGFIEALGNRFEGTDLAVLWMHQSGAEARTRLLARLDRRGCRVVVVRGSIDLRELETADRLLNQQRDNAVITVTLGAVDAPGGKRWLTWEEISRGTIEAIRTGKSQVIGTLS